MNSLLVNAAIKYIKISCHSNIIFVICFNQAVKSLIAIFKSISKGYLIVCIFREHQAPLEIQESLDQGLVIDYNHFLY